MDNYLLGHLTYPREWQGIASSESPKPDIPHDQGTSAIVKQINYIVNVYIDGILCCFGFIGNTFVIFILHKDKCKSSNNFFLLALAVYDILLLIFILLYTTLRSVYPATGHLEAYHKQSSYIIAYVLPFGWMAQTGNNWITTVVAGERYLAISKPFKAVRWCTVGNAKRLTVLLSIINFLFNFPRFIHYHMVAFYTDSNSTFVSHVKFNLTWWNSDIYHYLYHVSLTCILLFIIPLSSLIFFNHHLIKILKATTQTRANLTANGQQKRHSVVEMHRMNSQVTLNVIVLITKFIICQLPDFILAILGAFGALNAVFEIMSIFAQMLLVFNSAVNFYIYLIFNQKFRSFVTGRKCSCCCYTASKQLHKRNSVYSVDGSQRNSIRSPLHEDNYIMMTYASQNLENRSLESNDDLQPICQTTTEL